MALLVIAHLPCSAADQPVVTVPGTITTARTPAPVFRTVPDWGKIAGDPAIGSFHGGIAVDRAGNVYVGTNHELGIAVFSREGELLRTMAPDFAGTHSLLVRREAGTEYLYGVHLRRRRAFKMTLDGNPIMILPFPKASRAYDAKGAAYKPSAIAVAPDGSIFVGDTYGTSLIHKYTSLGQYLLSFGGRGKEDGKFLNCQALAIDTRFGRPLLLVADRDSLRLQYFDLDGKFQRVFATGLAHPTALAIHGRYLAVAEMQGRVTIFDERKVVAHLGDNPDQKQWAKFDLPRDQWKEGTVAAPHGLAWDLAGGLYVQDWNKTGRISKFQTLR